jgi:hypothetical protein
VAAALRTGKTVCEDTDTTRLDETVGFIVFEQGQGTIAGVEFVAFLGADTIRGTGNSPPYSYSFNSAFGSAPQMALVTMAGMDGNNGSWAQIHGATMTSTTSVYMSIEEDVIGDSERNHTTEQVGYVVFGAPVVYPECVGPAECDDGVHCNGAEDCVGGNCVAGLPVSCDDGVACDGIEVGDPVLDCLPGILVDVSSDNYSGSEIGGQISITVELSSASCETVTVDHGTIDDTARQPEDHRTVSGTLTFEPGEPERAFRVLPMEDSEREGDEAVTLALSDPSGAAPADVCNPAVLIIKDPREAEIVRYTTTRYGYCGALGMIPCFGALFAMSAWKSTNKCDSSRAWWPRRNPAEKPHAPSSRQSILLDPDSHRSAGRRRRVPSGLVDDRSDFIPAGLLGGLAPADDQCRAHLLPGRCAGRLFDAFRVRRVRRTSPKAGPTGCVVPMRAEHEARAAIQPELPRTTSPPRPYTQSSAARPGLPQRCAV